MAIDLYTPLAYQVSRVRGCGIARGELVIVGTQRKPSFNVILRAEPRLWERIASAAPYTYPDDVVDAFTTMVRPVLHFIDAGEVYLTPNEALSIGLADADELQLAGISNDEGTYTVPDAMLNDDETYNRMQHPNTPGLYWACTLNKRVCYDAENPTHPAGLSMIIVPDGPYTVADFAKVVSVTEPGWNWAAVMSPEDFTHVANQLHRNMAFADPLGA